MTACLLVKGDKVKVVKKCWGGLIGKEESDSLLDNPLSVTGVLVGIRDGNGAG